MAVADETLSNAAQQRMVELCTTGPLLNDEREECEALRAEYGRTTLRRARVMALLSLRSGKRLLADADTAWCLTALREQIAAEAGYPLCLHLDVESS